MKILLSDHLSRQVEEQIGVGGYRTADELVEDAVSRLLDQHAEAQKRIEALDRIVKMVDEAGLYERVLVPADE